MHFTLLPANKCAFKGLLIGLEGDEIVLYMKVQSTYELSVTHDKGIIKWYKTPCNLEAHLNTILRLLIREMFNLPLIIICT